ncbi:MAG: ParB/RepB/Spo0J family partition protein [Bacteroidales bacterium]|nr:ParB/RepB/Spo0J family partition protein [Bacteroidales bacterium]
MSRFKIKEVELSKIDLIEKNARFMTNDTFMQLVSNIKRDGQLSSVPFVVEKENGKFVVVSGNHRVQAAKQAGLVKVNVMYVHEDNITNDEIRAIQLSHNSIEGQDDPEILRQLLDEIQDVAMKEYAHISREILDGAGDLNYTIELPNNEMVPVTLMFVDASKVQFDELMEKLDTFTPRELENMTIMDREYLTRLNEVSNKVQQKYKIKAQALSICKMVELVNLMLDGTTE